MLASQTRDPVFEAAVRDQLDRVESALLRAAEADTPMVREAAQHVILAGGKRFRPLLVVLDNLPAHKVSGVREHVEACGASLLYLPSYSPDLNPIEQAFGKLKALLRKAAVRTIEDLWHSVGSLRAQLSPDECANYLANSGYPRSA